MKYSKHLILVLSLFFSIPFVVEANNCTFDKIPIAAGLYQADASCTDGVWTHYYQSSGNLLLLSIQQDDQMVLAPEAVTVGVSAESVVYDLTNLSYTSSNIPWIVMSRYWKVNPQLQPENEIRVRMYYTQSDLNAVKQTVNDLGGNITDGEDIIFFALSEGIDPDPSKPNPHQGATSSDFLPLNQITGNIDNLLYAEFPINTLASGGAGGTTINNILPIELSSFELKEVDAKVEIRWTTATEVNNRYFFILRSLDGVDFIPIDRLDGGGTVPQPRQYYATDYKPWLGQNYYRLMQEDFDGRQQMSEIKTLKYKGNRYIDIVPTKVINETRIEIPIPFTVNASIKVFDSHGHVVLESVFPAGDYRKTLDTSMLSVGNYLVKVSNGLIFLSKRFIKVH